MKSILLILTLFIAFQSSILKADEIPAESEVSVDSNLTYYILPDEKNLTTPTIGISYGNIYFEGRYNYEAENATSLWLGRPYSFGSELEVEIIPMAGAVLGEIEGAAPGLELDADWRQLNFYIEAEYVFNFDTRDENFFYSWSEFTYGLNDWLRVGLAASRTRLYSSSVEIDRGPFVAFSTNDFTFSCAALNLDDQAIIVFNMSLGFN